MPAKVLPTEETFGRFRQSLLNRGFREIQRKESRTEFKRLELQPPSPRKGREAGFRFDANGLTVIVWTTYLTEESQSRERDAGWVLIREGDEVKYFTHPMHRTKNFLRNLLGYAAAARLRSLNRPLCPECQARMNIVRGQALKQRFWQCPRSDAHEQRRPVSLPWDYMLPPEAVEFVKKPRAKRRKQNEKLRAAGKKPGAAQRARKGWKVGRPENIEAKR